VSDYTKLTVWRKAHLLALDVYRISQVLPTSERYGLQSQIRRSVVSIAANVAEGSGRSTDRDFARFVSNAIGSASELEYELMLAMDLGYLNGTDVPAVRERVVEVRKMLLSLRAHLRSVDS
jgi:four helix bundle protein